MDNSTTKKSNKNTERILRIYQESTLEKNLDKQVKMWLISDFHKNEKDVILQYIWNNLNNVDEKGKEEAWKAIMEKTGISKPPQKSLTRRRIIEVAAIFIPFLILAGNFIIKNNFPEPDSLPGTQQITVKTEEETQHILLSDGTQVWLNKNSEFTYNEDRRTHLKGEALFNVTHNDEHQFTVQTGDLTITVAGTTFNVRGYPEEEEINVALYEGMLELAAMDTTVKMNFGDEWTFNRRQGSWQKNITARSGPAWRKDYVIYENTPLRNVFHDLEKIYSATIDVDDTTLLDNLLTLKFEDKTPINEVMFLISYLNGGFNYQIEDNLIRINTLGK